MPSIKKKAIHESSTEVEEMFNPVEYLKSLPTKAFLDCKDTRDILLTENYWKFEEYLKIKLADLYRKYHKDFFQTNLLFDKDPDIMCDEVFADIIYNYISPTYDLSIFYDNPKLAEELFK